jgi:hypothetical protein
MLTFPLGDPQPQFRINLIYRGGSDCYFELWYLLAPGTEEPKYELADGAMAGQGNPGWPWDSVGHLARTFVNFETGEAITIHDSVIAAGTTYHLPNQCFAGIFAEYAPDVRDLWNQ